MSDESRHVAQRQRQAWQEFDAGESSVAPDGWPDHAGIAELEAHDRTFVSLTEVLSDDTLSLIVEVSPVINSPVDRAAQVAAFVQTCEAHGAVGVAIPVDSHDASPVADIQAARDACALPLIARGMLLHPLQLRAVRAAGAHAVLLPAHVFDHDSELEHDYQLAEIVAYAQQLGLEAGVSVRSADQLELAMAADPDLLNIDNRIRSGSVNIDRTLELLADVPVGTPVLSESIAQADEVARLQRAGVDGLVLDDAYIGDELEGTLAAYRTLMLDEHL